MSWPFFPEHPPERDALCSRAIAESEARMSKSFCHQLDRHGQRGVNLLHAGNHFACGEEVRGFFGCGRRVERVHQRIDIRLHIDNGFFLIVLFHNFGDL